MKIEYTLCDRCGKSIPEATGAILMIYGGAPQAHLCSKCLAEVIPPPMSDLMEKIRLMKSVEVDNAELEAAIQGKEGSKE